MNRVTEGWLRRFIHAYKNASFMDKMTAVYQEANPYYLLEWIVIDGEDGEDDGEFWLNWEGERTPGSEKGGLAGVETFFHYELPYELCFSEPVDEWRFALIRTAVYELANFYGAERWNKGCVRLHSEIESVVERYKNYEHEVAEQVDKLQQDLLKEKRELEAEAQEWESESDLDSELKAVELKYERRKREAPSKVLHKSYENDRLLRYIVQRNLQRPAERLKAFARKLTDSSSPVLEWIPFIDRGDTETIAEWYEAASRGGKAAFFAQWFSTFISKSGLTRREFDTAPRRQFALELLGRLNEPVREVLIHWLFQTQGIEEAIAARTDDTNDLHLLVWSSLPHPERRKLLREGVILISWEAFASTFAQAQPEIEFERLSWVFCLDPESLRQRLLRVAPGEGAPTSDEIVRKCCTLFAEGIRRGVNPELIVSLYEYLAKHDKEAFYSFVHGAKSLSEALPIFEAPQQIVAPLFRGDGVRQASARRHVLRLLFEWLERRERDAGSDNDAQLCRLAAVISYDKRTAALSWLQRHERDWREFLGVEGEKLSLMRLLKFRWLGTKGDVREQHAAVEEWLERHSDWVQFESDAPIAQGNSMQYRIVRPGAIDAETGELLARVLVRAEWYDRKQVNQLLDDLRSL